MATTRRTPKVGFTIPTEVLADLDSLAEEDRAKAKATVANKSATVAALIVAERARRGPAKRVRTPPRAACDEPLSDPSPTRIPAVGRKKVSK